ncbi:MAG: adenylate/guanylate cyclase domain-containing protein [Elusimicrobia bacterium]|nr:adenylate/guanylate cyclase domain-containing protein [Elusimicrobiota bacterium]
MSAETGQSRFPLRFSLAFSVVFLVLYWPGFIGLNWVPGLFHHMEDVWNDRMFATHAASLPSADPRIILAAVDDDTGKVYHFPLPREVYANLLDQLKKYGVKTVVFDVLFPEPREGDAKIVDATKRFGKAIHLFSTALKYTPVGRQYVVEMPIEGLTKTAEFLGYPNVDRVLDSDGHIRRFIFFDSRGKDPLHEDEIAPSVDAVALSSYLGKPISEVRADFGAPPDKLWLMNFRAPFSWFKHPKRDKRSQGKSVKVEDLFQVRSPYQTISVLDLLNGELTAEQKRTLKGSLVIVGSTTLGYFDHYPSPFNPESPGAEFHCNVIDNALHHDFLQLLGREWIVLILLLVIWMPLLLHGFPPVVGAGVTVAICAAWYAFVEYEFGRGVRVDFIAPEVALLASFLAQNVHRVFAEARKAKETKEMWSRFVSKEVVEDLVKNPDRVKLGGVKRDMTILFLDIAHFTNISEKMTADQLIVFLNKYLSALSGVITSRKAVVGNYIGDCIMAFWNPPVIELPTHRAEACLAAIECQGMIAKLNESLDHSMPEMPAIRVGLNSGTVTVGMTGSEGKLQYTTLGDEVNLASRLEGANKFFGSKIMASEATFEGAKDAVEARELGRVRVVGKDTPIRVYELLSPKGKLSDEWRKALPFYEQGLVLFNKRDYAHAVVAFQEVVKVFPKDGPATLYLNASKDYSAIPPQDDWDGVFNLTAK